LGSVVFGLFLYKKYKRSGVISGDIE
jgi:hypothetical protein